MYQYPLLLLTGDDVRNATLADLLEDEMIDTTKLKKKFYDNLTDDMPLRNLYDLVEIEVIMTKMICDIFRSHMNVMHKDLPNMDRWRLKERLKRTLTIVRRRCSDILHTFDDYSFGDTLRKLELWEENCSRKDSTPEEWNANFLNRVSDIHRHLFRYITVIEPRLLVRNQQLKTSDGSEYDDAVNSISKTLEACRTIYKEIKDYVRLVDSL